MDVNHLSRGQLERYRGGGLSKQEIAQAESHLADCADCRLSLDELSSHPIKHTPKKKPAKPPPAATPPKDPSTWKTFLQSPQLVLMLAAGIALIFAVPYFAFRTLPEAVGDQSSANNVPDVPLDLSDLDRLPAAVSDARLIVTSEQPELPEVLLDVPPPSGFGLLYPVLESVDSTRPTMTWQPIGPPPYRILLTDQRKQMIARGDNLPNPRWLVPVDLQRGSIYTWQMTSPDGTSEIASFRVLSDEEFRVWQGIRAQFADSHLVLGAVAEYLGLLTTAEREFQELARQNPNSQHAGLLLDNVLALRETDPEAQQ